MKKIHKIHVLCTFVTLAFGCEIGTVNITSSDGGDVGEDSTTEVETTDGATSTTPGDSVTSTSGPASSSGGEGTEESTGGVIGCLTPLGLGEGGVTSPEPGYTVSGCFTDTEAFGCMTCADWCLAGEFGDCVGGAPLDDCTNQVGQGYIVACDEPFDDEAAWKCVCTVEQ